MEEDWEVGVEGEDRQTTSWRTRGVKVLGYFHQELNRIVRGHEGEAAKRESTREGKRGVRIQRNASSVSVVTGDSMFRKYCSRMPQVNQRTVTTNIVHWTVNELRSSISRSPADRGLHSPLLLLFAWKCFKPPPWKLGYCDLPHLLDTRASPRVEK